MWNFYSVAKFVAVKREKVIGEGGAQNSESGTVCGVCEEQLINLVHPAGYDEYD